MNAVLSANAYRIASCQIDYLDFTDMNIHTVPAADLEAGYAAQQL